MEKKAFRLGGEQYRLSRSDVEKKMRDVQPKPVGKYQVLVSGVFYPPKQVIAETLGKELVSFTTMDATRVLSALGFDVLGRGTSRSPVKNESASTRMTPRVPPPGELEREFSRAHQMQTELARRERAVGRRIQALARGLAALMETGEYRSRS